MRQGFCFSRQNHVAVDCFISTLASRELSVFKGAIYKGTRDVPLCWMSACRAGCQVTTVSTSLSFVFSQPFTKYKLQIHYCYYCCDYMLLPVFRTYRHIIHLNTILWHWNYLNVILIQWRFTALFRHLTPVKWHLTPVVSTELIHGCSHSSKSIWPFCWQTHTHCEISFSGHVCNCPKHCAPCAVLLVRPGLPSSATDTGVLAKEDAAWPRVPWEWD